MKFTVLKTFLLAVALLALGSVNHASAATCNASYTMTAVTASGFTCTTADGNLTFSNFDFEYQAGLITGCTTGCTAPATPNPTSEITVLFAQLANGDSDPFGTTASATTSVYSVITDYSGDTTVNEFQTESGIVQFMVTNNVSGQSIMQVDSAANGMAENGASGEFIKNLCNGTQFSGGTNPNANCTPAANMQNAGDINFGSSGNQSDSSSDFQTINDTSAGVADSFNLSGGNTNSSANATITSNENDFVLQANATTTPEPGTIVLLGGSLIALGAIRRRKSA